MAVSLLNFNSKMFVGDTVPVTAGDLPAYHTVVNGREVLVFPDGSDEYAAVTKAIAMPQQYAAGTLTAKIHYISAATTGDNNIEVYVEAVTDGDAVDLDSATSFDSVNDSTTTVPGTAGHLDVISVTLTNKDSVAAGDMVRFMVRRDSDDAGDTAAADFRLILLEIQE